MNNHFGVSARTYTQQKAPLIGRTAVARQSKTIYLITIFFGLATLAACAQLQKRSTDAHRAPQSVQRQLQNGRYDIAARELLRLSAGVDPVSAANYRLQAADAFLKDGNTLAAKNTLRRIVPGSSNDVMEIDRRILTARLALAENQPHNALATLEKLSVKRTPRRTRRHYHQALANTYEALGNAVQVARERIALAPLLLGETDRATNRRAIWAAVSTLPAPEMQGLVNQPEPLAGWITLALIPNSTASDADKKRRYLDEWRDRHPGHPAALEILGQLYGKDTALHGTPRQVGMLLPFEGKLSHAAAAIRDGFVNAWYADSNNPNRPKLKLYNANKQTILQAYELALGEGAEFIVGPLEKSAVQTLAKHGNLAAPTLALNQINVGHTRPSPSTDNLFQFGLVPEQEAWQLAERALADGRTKAFILAPNNRWGMRVSKAFKRRWQTLGGEIADHQTYRTNSTDYSAPVGRIIERVSTGSLGGKGFLFLAAFPTQAQQICPLFLPHSTTNFPIYSTSHIYTRPTGEEIGYDLNGVIYGDMPWLFDHGYRLNNASVPSSSKWPMDSATYQRLYMLGADAYRLIPHLDRLRTQQFAGFDGKTGKLQMDATGRISRKLSWAKIVNGSPRLLR